MKRILIIDDEAQIREMLKEMFEREGYQVMEASDGGKGIKLFKEQGADLIITDIIMPEIEGIETIIEFKRKFPATKIIAISGGGRIGADHYLEIAKKMGAARTFIKPCDRKLLLTAVKELLE